MKMKIKICGIRTSDEGIEVCSLQPDSIGVYVDQDMIKNVTDERSAIEVVDYANKNKIETFLLTISNDAEYIINVCNSIKNSHLQVIKDISIESLDKIKKSLPNVKIVKVVSITGEEALEIAHKWDNCESVDELLLDSKEGDICGGTGKTHDWNISKRIVEMVSKPVWLAGGININNIEKAIETVKPYGIDLETGAQNPDGSKNLKNIEKLIDIVHSF